MLGCCSSQGKGRDFAFSHAELDIGTVQQSTSWACPRAICQVWEGHANPLTMETVTLCLLGTSHTHPAQVPGLPGPSAASQGRRLPSAIAHPQGELKGWNQTTTRSSHQTLLPLSSPSAAMGTVGSSVGSSNSSRPCHSPRDATGATSTGGQIPHSGPPARLGPQHRGTNPSFCWHTRVCVAHRVVLRPLSPRQPPALMPAAGFSQSCSQLSLQKHLASSHPG